VVNSVRQRTAVVVHCLFGRMLVGQRWPLVASAALGPRRQTLSGELLPVHRTAEGLKSEALNSESEAAGFARFVTIPSIK
jgi:hypothetical protein